MNKVLQAFIVGVGVLMLTMYICRFKPAFEFGGNVDTPPLFVILNPFRDRTPEVAAEKWIREERTDIHRSGVKASNSQICGTADATLNRWSLKMRRDHQAWPVFLEFKIYCSNGNRYLTVDLDESSSGWHVIKWGLYESLNRSVK
jgi:hypothetical protein